MSEIARFENRLKERRMLRGWSQAELAQRSAVSRAGISAIETDRLIPSAAAALALAAALDCRVEDLFRLRGPEARELSWAWSPVRDPCRYWKAELGGKIKRFPVEGLAAGLICHDGVFRAGVFDEPDAGLPAPDQTLVMACCDPAVGLLAAELARVAGIRLIALPRASRAALSLLEQGLVHVAGVHLAAAGRPGGNARVVKRTIGAGYRLIRGALWEEGIAHAPGLTLATIGSALASPLRWVGREVGSGARVCLDELFGDRRPPKRVAADHRGVAEAVRGGWADLGICLRLVSEDAGLGFLPVRDEVYDLCFDERIESDHRIQALLAVLRSPTYRRALGELPGYDSAQTGLVERVS
jgi:molybdate-binding protein/DNA-binding XRE family transcriptional regulator